MAGRRTERIRAIVLDRTKLKEQDLILTLLAQTGEQVRVVAKGARKPGTRLAARTELFCDVDMLISRGRGLGIVTEAQVLDAHAGFRGELEPLACASALCEVARLTCYEDMEDSFLHPLLNRALTACEQANNKEHLMLSLSAYTYKVLSHEGWRPELEQCVACGEYSSTRFSVLAGGTLCESCSQGVEGAEPITQNQIGWIHALITQTFDVLLAAEIDRQTASYLMVSAHRWAATHLDARLKAFEFFAGV